MAIACTMQNGGFSILGRVWFPLRLVLSRISMGTAADAFATADFANATAAEGAAAEGAAGDGKNALASLSLHAFLEHFRSIAEGHFAVRRLERAHGKERIRLAYEAIQATRDARFNA
jgi:hypothetical protein